MLYYASYSLPKFPPIDSQFISYHHPLNCVCHNANFDYIDLTESSEVEQLGVTDDGKS